MTSQEPRTPHSVDSDNPDTEVIVVSSPAPVFVDSTGRRRRLLRRLSYVFGGLCMVYGGLVSVSLAGGPVSSSAVLPLPDLRDDAEEAAGPRPAPAPAPSVSVRPVEVYDADVAPRRRPAADITRITPSRAPVVSARPSAKPSASAAPTSAKPVESTTAPASTSPTPVPTVSTPAPDLPVRVPIPAPPAPLSSSSDEETVAAPVSFPVELTAEPDEEPDDESATEETTGPADTPEPSVGVEGTA